jgi:hypothetical protein
VTDERSQHKGFISRVVEQAWNEFVASPGKRVKTGERGRIRTCDPCLKRALLYHLSYAPILLKLLVYPVHLQ